MGWVNDGRGNRSVDCYECGWGIENPTEDNRVDGSMGLQYVHLDCAIDYQLRSKESRELSE